MMLNAKYDEIKLLKMMHKWGILKNNPRQNEPQTFFPNFWIKELAENINASDRISYLEKRLQKLESMLGVDYQKDKETNIRSLILNDLKSELNKISAGSYIAITYNGNILKVSDNRIELMKAISTENNIGKKIFIHRTKIKI